MKYLKNKKYNLNYHLKAFSKLIDFTHHSISNIVISFIDLYKNVKKNNEKIFKNRNFLPKEIDILAKEFKNITDKYNLNIFTCCKKDELLR